MLFSCDACQNDLFFHYSKTINEKTFRDLQKKQGLMISLGEYPSILVKMINTVVREPTTHIVILLIDKDDPSQSRLEFIQNFSYKLVELMSIDVAPTPELTMQKNITYRYHLNKQRLIQVQGRLNEINSLVKQKNPSLLLQLQEQKPLSDSASPRYRV